MKTYRYTILPLFAFSLAVSSPVLAAEGDSPTVPKDEVNATTSSEAPKLPFEKDPDGSGTDQDTSEASATGDDGESASTADDGADSGDGADGDGGGEG